MGEPLKTLYFSIIKLIIIGVGFTWAGHLLWLQKA